ncbi:MAG: hypothetical protein J0H17_09575 [Rhizobiales bacterium]|nr:hypothetical protein [Hyphomicrobiales bacterium]
MNEAVDRALTEIAEGKLWGAAEIARFIGVSCDHVYRLASDPRVPIYRPPGAGRYFAFKTELKVWLRTKASEFS